MQNLYGTLSDFKHAGWLNITETTFDAAIMRILESASRDMDTHTKRHFFVNDKTVTFDGAGATLFFPDDLLSISSFTTDEDGSKSYATTLATTDYELYSGSATRVAYRWAKLSNESTVGSFANSIRNGVRITGSWGYGNDISATPYSDSGAVVNTGGITSSATTHALATGKGASFQAGQTIRIATEQMFISSISTDTLTLVRGLNGTTAAAHLAADLIYIYSYPAPIVDATLIHASRIWDRRKSAFATSSGNAVTGEYQVYKGLDPDVAESIKYYVFKTF